MIQTIDQARDWFADHGFVVPHDSAVADGRIRRFRVGDSHKRNGWCYLVEHRGRIYGAAGDWRTGSKMHCGDQDAGWFEVKSMRGADSARGALESALCAKEDWLKLAEKGGSRYLDRKGVPAYGLRFGRGCVVVPMLRYAGAVEFRTDGLAGLQRIYENGKKFFSKGCDPRATCYHIGMIPDARMVTITEGYASAASLYMATGLPAVVAFTCGNLLAVGEELRRTHPLATLIFAADNDHQTDGNPGLAHANKASRAVDGKVIVPRGIVGTDVNDYHAERGLEALSDMVYGCL